VLTKCVGGQEINLVGRKGGSIDTRAEALQSSHDLATHVTLHDVNSVLQLPAIRIRLVDYTTLYQLLWIITSLENRDDSWLMCQITTEPWNTVGKTTRQTTYYNETSCPFAQFLYLLSYSNSLIPFQLQRALLWRFIVAGNNKPIFLPDFNQIWVFSTHFHSSPQYQILRKSFQREPQTDGRTWQS
jgi:hypothetical protein